MMHLGACLVYHARRPKGGIVRPLWTPSTERVEAARLTGFRRRCEARWGHQLPDYDALHAFSVAEPEKFWLSVWDEAGIVGSAGNAPYLVDGDRMPGARFFPEARLNYAENLLRAEGPEDAIVFWGEDRIRRRLSRDELRTQVARCAGALRAIGVGEGDRVAGYLPNMPETVIGMLAATSIGAVWSSASPDFGVQGVLDRFGQIEPKVLITCDGYFYGGKIHDTLGKAVEVAAALPSLERTLVVPYAYDRPVLSGVPKASLWDDALAEQSAAELSFNRLPFDHPLFILFSSGTTGAPKCIVHRAGGVLLQHVKELMLHSDVHAGDRVFYFTTCGWMMWNWLVTALAAEATLILYDGSPFHPDGNVLFDYAVAEKVTLFGTSAKWIDAIKKAELSPRETHDLSTVRTICSTGSPLVPESFDYVYENIKTDVQLASISGGTDIVSCFMLGNPTGSVWRGEIQAKGLGMAVDVFDDNGRSVQGDKGELVCVKPFPSMPLGFWRDKDGSRYRAAYFERYDNIWCHGDYVEQTEHGGIVMFGRSDAVLNPGGVRIGTAEIYRQVEQLEEVIESIVIGQDWDNDVRVVLFVRLRDGLALDDELVDRIKRHIRATCTPRHVPAKVIQVSDIPRTKSGKIVELAVRDVVHSRPIKNKEALANPEALDQFRDRAELLS